MLECFETEGMTVRTLKDNPFNGILNSDRGFSVGGGSQHRSPGSIDRYIRR